ncbi:MAG TPA: ABC transporter permease [Candidatus Saccharimonadales bacterium]|nr:ABC transporter permease [Candidatus Saccharimonadales bacterium]
MNWFVFRQHRKTFMIFGILLIAFAIFAIVSGNYFWHTYQHALATCHDFATPTDPQGTCDTLGNTLFQGDGAIVDTIVLTGFGAPLLVGLFLGAPLFAREYEENTNKLVWTQSISRRKWLTTKLLWALGFAALYGLILTLLTTHWFRTDNALNHDRFDTGLFDIQGLMPFIYTIFFTAVGFTMGVWWRKTLVALGVTLAIFVLAMASFGQWIRPHYMAPITVTAPMGPNAINNKIPTGAWILTKDIVDKNGKTFDSFDLQNMPAQCRAIIEDAKNGNGIHVKAAVGGPGGDPIDNCLNHAGYHQMATYQPPYRYWDFQRIEAGIFLGMTAVAVGATYWLVLKRDA